MHYIRPVETLILLLFYFSPLYNSISQLRELDAQYQEVVGEVEVARGIGRFNESSNCISLHIIVFRRSCSMQLADPTKGTRPIH